MNDAVDGARHPKPGPGNAFLLAQLGDYAARRFAERIADLDLTPPQAGVLRLIAQGPGQSQQAIAGHLGMPASRLVALVDGLEKRGFVERRRNPDDRRNYALHLTGEGGRFMGRLARAGKAHEDAICAGLDATERATLLDLLGRIAAEHGLSATVHHGYRRA